MITLATRRRHLNNNNGTTTPLAAARGSLDPPNNNNYKNKKHYRRNMNSSNLTLLRIYSVVCTLLLICSLTYQLKILHDEPISHRSSGMRVNSWDYHIIDLSSATDSDSILATAANIADDEDNGKCRIYGLSMVMVWCIYYLDTYVVSFLDTFLFLLWLYPTQI